MEYKCNECRGMLPCIYDNSVEYNNAPIACPSGIDGCKWKPIAEKSGRIRYEIAKDILIAWASGNGGFSIGDAVILSVKTADALIAELDKGSIPDDKYKTALIDIRKQLADGMNRHCWDEAYRIADEALGNKEVAK